MMENQATTRAEYAAQGKSNNYLAAQAAGRLTAGQAAKVLSKRLGRPVKAKDLEPFATEYHHAGCFGGNKARRVFFFAAADLERITAADLDRAALPVWGWVLGFKPVYDGPYGRKRYVPTIAEVGQFDQAKAKRLGEKFHLLTEAEAAEAKGAEGKVLPPSCEDWRQAEV